MLMSSKYLMQIQDGSICLFDTKTDQATTLCRCQMASMTWRQHSQSRWPLHAASWNRRCTLQFRDYTVWSACETGTLVSHVVCQGTICVEQLSSTGGGMELCPCCAGCEARGSVLR